MEANNTKSTLTDKLAAVTAIAMGVFILVVGFMFIHITIQHRTEERLLLIKMNYSLDSLKQIHKQDSIKRLK